MSSFGRVTVDVHRAYDLIGLNPGRTSNPFATVTIGKDSFSTKVIEKSCYPGWEEKYKFEGVELPAILTVQLYNKQLYSGIDEPLGTATLTLFDSKEQKKNVILTHGGNAALASKAKSGCGSIDISYEIEKISEQEARAAIEKMRQQTTQQAKEDEGALSFLSQKQPAQKSASDDFSWLAPPPAAAAAPTTQQPPAATAAVPVSQPPPAVPSQQPSTPPPPAAETTTQVAPPPATQQPLPPATTAATTQPQDQAPPKATEPPKPQDQQATKVEPIGTLVAPVASAAPDKPAADGKPVEPAKPAVPSQPQMPKVVYLGDAKKPEESKPAAKGSSTAAQKPPPHTAAARPASHHRVDGAVRPSSSSPVKGRVTSHVDAALPLPHHVESKKKKLLYSNKEALLQAACTGDAAAFVSIRQHDPLLMHGFDTVRDYSGRTPLHLAAWHSHINVLETLLKPVVVDRVVRHPMIRYDSLVSSNGNTVLHSAVYGGNAVAVNWLLQLRGISEIISTPNKRGMTPQHVAMELGLQEIADALGRCNAPS